MSLFLYSIMPLVVFYCFLIAPSRSAVVWSGALGFIAYFPLVLIQFALRFAGLATNNIEVSSLFWFYFISDYAVPVGFLLAVAFWFKLQKLIVWEDFAPVGTFFAVAFMLMLVTTVAFGHQYDGMYEFIYRPLTLTGLVIVMSFTVLKPFNPLGWLMIAFLLFGGGLLAALVLTNNFFMAKLTAGIGLVFVVLFWFITRFVIVNKELNI
jgi:hypothetical protein